MIRLARKKDENVREPGMTLIQSRLTFCTYQTHIIFCQANGRYCETYRSLYNATPGIVPALNGTIVIQTGRRPYRGKPFVRREVETGYDDVIDSGLVRWSTGYVAAGERVWRGSGLAIWPRCVPCCSLTVRPLRRRLSCEGM